MLGHLKRAGAGAIIVVLGGVLLAAVVRGATATQEVEEELPNYNYAPDIQALRAEGKPREALDLARYVLRNPDLPGQEDTARLERELDHEVNGLMGRSFRVVRGAIMGSGDSLEEMVGAVGTDFFVVGDIRDLVIQGGKWASDGSQDPVVIALAGIGVVTEIPALKQFDLIPAVLKCFRKIGALTERFARYIVDICKSFAKTRKADDILPLLSNTHKLCGTVGLARTSGLYKHIRQPDDLAALAKWADRSPDATCIAVRHGGDGAVDAIKRLPDTAESRQLLEKAAKKGPRGWFLLSPKTSKIGVAAGVGKSLRLGRIQGLLYQIALKSATARWIMAGTGLVFLLLGTTLLASAGRALLGGLSRIRRRRSSMEEDDPSTEL